MPDRDDDLDQPMADAVRRYARSADAPADHAAIARRAMAAPVHGTGPTWRMAGGLAAVALAAGVLIAVVALNVLRPGPTPIPVGASPSASPTEAAVTSPSAAASSAVPSASAAPSASAFPSLTPEPASPSAAPSTSAEPSAAPSISPSASASASASAPASPSGGPGAPVPSDFAAQSVTFVSPDEGFVLGSVACGSARCPAIVHTTDAGATWALLAAAPKTAVTPVPLSADATDKGVGVIRFADADHGWLFGPSLWATTDGGATWSAVTLPVAGPVLALETSRGQVHAVVFDNASSSFRILSSAVGSASWTASSVSLPVGAGPVPSIQLVLSGTAGWVVQVDRTVVNGARLVSGAWHAWTPVCADVVGPAYVAAATASDVDATCDVGTWATPQGTHLFASTDGGATSAQVGARVPVDASLGIATPDGRTVTIGGSTSAGNVLVGSFDRGATWKQVLDLGSRMPVDLGYTTPQQGVVVGVDPSQPAGRLYMTRDGGQTWAAVTF